MAGRKAAWPPEPRENKGQDRIRWRGHDYYLGKTGTPEAKARLGEVLAEIQAEEERRKALARRVGAGCSARSASSGTIPCRA